MVAVVKRNARIARNASKMLACRREYSRPIRFVRGGDAASCRSNYLFQIARQQFELEASCTTAAARGMR